MHLDLPSDLKGLDALVATLTADGGYEAATTDAKRLAETKTAMLADKPVHTAVLHALDKLTPTFFYFSDYSSLPGTVKIRELLEADRDKLDDDELTALSLLELAGADKDYLLQPDYETRKRELENVANSLTEDILDYWTTNQQIRVEIDITQKTIETQKAVQNPQAPYQQITVQSQTTVLDELKIRRIGRTRGARAVRCGAPQPSISPPPEPPVVQALPRAAANRMFVQRLRSGLLTKKTAPLIDQTLAAGCFDFACQP